ncbi:MAG TPA: EF-hand domain-containing protein, partial [Gemmataceae bacterium]|nr:EF-hand domain-containing protein [Gemmataceae bacterium]
MSSLRLLFVALLGLLLTAAEGTTQPGPGGFGGRRGGGGGGRDPGAMFDRFANGKTVLRRSDLTSPFLQTMFDRTADAAGITNGEMTREQWVGAMGQLQAARGGPQGAGGGAPPPSGNQGGGRGGRNNPEAWVQWAENQFSQFDKNGDGVLNSDEMPDELKAELDKWDTDHNGLIDLNEFKAFFQARMQQRIAERPTGQDPSSGPIYIETPAPEEDKKPVVYRSDNLPKGLPPWFAQLDTDKDAQIGLYEWKASGRSLDLFRTIDRNNDGFLTVEEVLFWQSNQ